MKLGVAAIADGLVPVIPAVVDVPDGTVTVPPVVVVTVVVPAVVVVKSDIEP
jgi:hypothetical protein